MTIVIMNKNVFILEAQAFKLLIFPTYNVKYSIYKLINT